MSRKFSTFSFSVTLLGGITAAVALFGILYETGVRPPWLEWIYVNYALSSDRVAERGYARLLTGDTAGGLKLFELGVRRDPASPYRWCDYSEALLALGDHDRACKCMLRALELAPNIGPILMRGINFFYRTGDPARALRYGAGLLAITDVYDGAVFAVWDQMELSTESIVTNGNLGKRGAQAYFRHLLGKPSRAPDSQVAWKWIRQHNFADDRLADDYATLLMNSGKAGEAAALWKSYVGDHEPGYTVENAIFNGSFEREPAGKIFDWRLIPIEGVRVARDPACAISGRYSLRLSFNHTQNVAYAHISQTVAVQAGNWRFEAHIRTEDITTNEGIGFRIVDRTAPQRLDISTERLTGTHDWTTLSAVFTVPAKTEVVQVQIFRSPSLKFDNKLGGTAWIDSVRLRREVR